MKQIKLTIDNKEITAQISDEDYKAVAPSKSGRWKPEDRERYWTVVNSGDATHQYWQSIPYDDFRYSQRNVFKTEEEAEHHLKVLKAKAAILDHADEVNEGWEPWWHGEEYKYYIYCTNTAVNLRVSHSIYNRYPFVVYYKSQEAAEAAIEAVGDEYKLIMGIE